MPEQRDDKLSGLLAEAVEQLMETPRADQLPTKLDAVVLRSLREAGESAAGSSASAVATHSKEKRKMALFVKSSLAALVFIATGAITWIGFVDRTREAYGALANQLENVSSIAYRVQWTDDAGLANLVPGDGDKVMHFAPSHDRIERANGSVLVIDTAEGKAVDLNPKTKTALVMNGQVAQGLAAMSRGPLTLMETLRKHFHTDGPLSQNVEALGPRKIGKIQVPGLRSTIAGEIVEVWIDPATSLPIEIRICLLIPAQLSDSVDGAIRQWRVISAIEYDIAIEAALLSVEVPLGYTTLQMPELAISKKPRASSLTDLIDLLRLCAEHNNATFPASLSMNDTPGTCMAIMKRFAGTQEEAVKSGTEIEKKSALKAVVEFGATLGRGTSFLYALKPENKLQYVGKGVKLNASDEPILWFSPRGDNQFQMVYADLSVKDVTASARPQAPTVAPQPRRRVSVRSISPRITFPRSAVTDYRVLQSLRKAGKQDEVRFLELQWMPEFMQDESASDSSPDSDASRFSFLKEFTNLEGLRVDYLTLTEHDLEAIGQCRKLKKLSLSGIQVAGPARDQHRLRATEFRHLAELTSLEMLDISQSEFADGVQYLGKLPNLTTLIISSFEHVNDASVAELKQLRHLQTLVLAGVYATNPEKTVTEVGLAGLKTLPSLRTLYIEYHAKWTLPVEKLQAMLPNVNVQPGYRLDAAGN